MRRSGAGTPGAPRRLRWVGAGQCPSPSASFPGVYRLRYLFFALLAGGAWLAFDAWSDQELRARLEASGVVTTGVIESGEVHSGRRNRKTYSLRVCYTPTGAAPIRRDFEVVRPFAERVLRDGVIVREQCEVCYDPEEPTSALLPGGTQDKRHLLWPGIGLFAAGALGSWWSLRPRAAASRAASS